MFRAVDGLARCRYAKAACKPGLFMVATALLVLGAGSAAATDAPVATQPAAKVGVVGPAQLEVELDNVSGSDHEEEGDIRPIISNSGDGRGKIAFSARLDSSDADCAADSVAVTPSVLEIEPFSTLAPVLRLTVPRSCVGEAGSLLLAVEGAAPANARFALEKDAEDVSYWLPFLVGLGVAAVFTIGFAWWRRSRLGEPVAAGSSWSFQDSWLTNVAALGAILGAALAASGFLDEVLPGLETGRFLGLNLLFGGMVLVAPLIYATSSKWEPVTHEGKQKLAATGRTWGVVLAAGSTLWGVIGQLVTLIVLASAAEAEQSVKYTIGGLLALAAVLVFVYAVAFTYGVTRDPDTRTGELPERVPDTRSGQLPDVSGTL